MGLQCPKCLNYSLKITDKLELPPDSHSDEITLQVIRCDQCSFEGIAIYEESRRGNLNDYSYNHTGYEVSIKALNQIKSVIKNNQKIPQRFFEVYDENKRWVWINSQTPKKVFPIKIDIQK